MDKSPSRIQIDRDLVQQFTQKEVEVDHLQNVILSLSTKIHTITDMEKEQSRARVLARENDVAREHLQVTLQESATTTIHRAEETKEYENKLGAENNTLRLKIDGQEQTIRDRDNTIHERNFTITNKDRNINELNLKLEDLKEMKTLNENLNKQINASEQRRVELQGTYDRSIYAHAEEMRAARADWKRQADDYVETIRK